MSQMLADDPILRKRLDDAAQRGRDQELKIIILEKEVERLKAAAGAAGAAGKPTGDSSAEDRDLPSGAARSKEGDRLAPPKAGFRSEDVAHRSKESRSHTTASSAAGSSRR